MLNEYPLVSCIMPTYNRRQFVPHALHYFQCQDYPNRELIVLDDGTDPIEDLIPDDNAIRYVRLPKRLPLGTKRNRACELAGGEIIAHWDDDDWMAPWRLSYQVEHLLNSEAGLCGLANPYFLDLEADRAWQYRYTGKRPWVAGGTMAYHRRVWEARPFDPVNDGEDTRFVWRLNAGQVLALDDSSFYIAFLHGANSSRKRTTSPRWRTRPAETVRAMLGDDEARYAAPASRMREPDSLPLVSCIMPTYNRREFVAQSVAYFLRQDYPSTELIIVDDGTDPIGDSLPDDPRIRYQRLKSRHSTGSKRNMACEAARGDIVVCWDDDDWYAPNRVSHQVAPLLSGEADVTGLGRSLLYCIPTGEAWQCTPKVHARMFFQQVIGGTLTFRKAFWDKGARFPDQSLAEDAALLKALLRKGARLKKLPVRDTFIYIRHDDNSWRFEEGRFVDHRGWKTVEQPTFMPDADLAFYQSLGQACAA